jgi:hypothetical protein
MAVKEKIVEETLDTIEETLDIMDKTIDAMEEPINIVKNNPWLLAGVGVIALSIGATAGYFIARKVLEPKYEKIAAQEIAEAKLFYASKHKQGNFSSPEMVVANLGIDAPEEVLEAVKEATEAMVRYKGEGETSENISDQMDEKEPAPKKIERKLPTQVKNIFVDNAPVEDDGEWSYEAELAGRTPGEPYIVHEDEYNENEDEHNQVTVTYFDGDDVLVDERERPIPDVDETIGLEATKLFGHGSRDPNIVYVRNDRLELDFEVVRSTGKYAEIVLGFVDPEDHIEHSDRHGSRQRENHDRRPKNRRFRGDDE